MLYEVKLSNGHSIKTTAKHKFLRADGLWVECNTLHGGDYLLEQQPVLLHDLVGLSDEASLLGWQQGARRWMRTLVGFLYCYWQDYRQCGEQLRWGEGTYLDVVQQLADGLPHKTHNGSRKDGVESEHIGSLSQFLRHLSILGAHVGAEVLRCSSEENCNDDISSELFLMIHSIAEQSRGSISLDELVRILASRVQAFDNLISLGESLGTGGQLSASVVGDNPFINPFSCSHNHHNKVQVKSIEACGEDVFYDLFVPFTNAYTAAGVYHHNSGKSWNVARILVHLAHHTPLRVVCAREFQNSIDESVHKLLADQIRYFGLPFTIDKYRIYNDIGSEFIFKGLSKQDAAAIKSLEAADILWVEEAQNVSDASWENSIPTIRKDGSEIWVTFNPNLETDATYRRFVLNPPPGADIAEVNFNDNPWFPDVLEQERLLLKQTDPVAYRHVWLGKPKTFSEGSYFRRELEYLTNEGRICSVPYDPSKPVWVWFDIAHAASGKSDPHACWFTQADGSGFNVIDYWEDNNSSWIEIARDVLPGKKYTYASIDMPHDAGRVNSQTKQTDADVLRGFGYKVNVRERTKSLEADMTAVRQVLPKCRFDAEKCKTGLAALRNHRQELDEKSGLWSFKHDWTSHAVSGFRSFALGHDDMRVSPVVMGTRRISLMGM
jgi:phage terminase large subunit